MPLIAEGSTVWTFQDAVEHLLDLHEIERTGLNTRRARASVLQAYRDLPQRHPWNYYYRQRLLSTVAVQTSSTLDYDHEGGAAPRLVTLAAGTWPDWAAFGRLIIDDVHYEVATRESSTTLTLESDSNPGADVAAGTSYTLYRSASPLPVNFNSLSSIWDTDEQRQLTIVNPVQHHSGLQCYYDTPQDPWEVMIRATGEYLGGWSLHFGPPPEAVSTYDLLYRVKPRPLAIDEYAANTIGIASGDATVTGTNTVFPLNCVGAVLRVSANGNKPTSVIGGIDGVDNPFVFQGVIKSRTSDTALELEEDADQTLSGVGYVISDPLDIAPGKMLTALLRLAEAEFCLKDGRKDAVLRQSLARQALLEAMEADKLIDNVERNASRYDPFSRTTLTSE
jgi:hypothetical protein